MLGRTCMWACLPKQLDLAQVAGMGRSASGFKLSPSLAASAILHRQSVTAALASDRVNAWQREERAHAAATGGRCAGGADGACSGKAASEALRTGPSELALALPASGADQEAVKSGGSSGTRACEGPGASAARAAASLGLAEGAATKQVAAPCCGSRRRRDELDGSAATACAEGFEGRQGAAERRGTGGNADSNGAEGEQAQLPALRLKTSVPSPVDCCKRSKTAPASPRQHKVGCHMTMQSAGVTKQEQPYYSRIQCLRLSLSASGLALDPASVSLPYKRASD